jgi:hypothetical protein
MREMAIQLHIFFTSAIEGSEWLTEHSGGFSSGAGAPCNHGLVSWSGHRLGVVAFRRTEKYRARGLAAIPTTLTWLPSEASCLHVQGSPKVTLLERRCIDSGSSPHLNTGTYVSAYKPS